MVAATEAVVKVVTRRGWSDSRLRWTGRWMRGCCLVSFNRRDEDSDASVSVGNRNKERHGDGRSNQNSGEGGLRLPASGEEGGCSNKKMVLQVGVVAGEVVWTCDGRYKRRRRRAWWWRGMISPVVLFW
jgi:hypothetical protein